MLHFYTVLYTTVLENMVWIFGALENLLRWGFEPANFERRRPAQTQRVLRPSTFPQQPPKGSKCGCWLLIHLPNGDTRPDKLKPSHFLASQVAGLQDCATSLYHSYCFILLTVVPCGVRVTWPLDPYQPCAIFCDDGIGLKKLNHAMFY